MRRATVLAASVAVVLAGVLAAAASQGATQGRWVIRDLEGGPATLGILINDRGQVVWHKMECGECDNAADEYSIAYVWQKGRRAELTLGGHGAGSEAVAISGRGQVVGWGWKAGRWRHAFLWQNGTMRDLGTLGGPSSRATAINDRGQVVGFSHTTAKVKYSDYVSHAFL